MEKTKTNIINLNKGDVLTPQQVLDLNILHGVGQTWLYQYWCDLGGVVIGSKKFILKEKLYAKLGGSEWS